MNASHFKGSFRGRLFPFFLIVLGALLLLLLIAWLAHPVPVIANIDRPGPLYDQVYECGGYEAGLLLDLPYERSIAQCLWHGLSGQRPQYSCPDGYRTARFGWRYLDQPSGDPGAHLPGKCRGSSSGRSDGYQHGGSHGRSDQHRRPHAQRDQHPGPDWNNHTARLPAVCRPSVTAPIDCKLSAPLTLKNH